MPKIRIYLKSGNQFEIDVKHFIVKRDTHRDIVTSWEVSAWVEGIYPRIIMLPPGNIEAVLQLTED